MAGIRRRRVEVATTASGDLWFPLIDLEGADDGPTLVVTAGIHGDEYEGVHAIHELARIVDPQRLRGRIRLVPVAHVAAFAVATRTSPVDYANLARVFPGSPDGSTTERLAAALFRTLIPGADLLVDCHSGGVRLAFAAVAGFYGEADQVARGLGFPYLWRLPPRDGVLSYEAHKAGLRVAGCEAGGRGGCLAEDAALYRDAVLRLAVAEAMLPPPAPEAAPPRAVLSGDWQLAPVGGLVQNLVAIGDGVEEGAPLAVIRDPFGDEIATLHAPFAGFVMGTRHLLTIQPGEWATCVVREEPLP